MFSGRKFSIALQRQMQMQFLPQANENYMVDTDVVSCCLHASGRNPQLLI